MVFLFRRRCSVRPGNFVTLPNQPIDNKGNISIPYTGLVPAAGKTPSQVEQEIVDRIKNRSIEPQVMVALVTQNTSPSSPWSAK